MAYSPLLQALHAVSVLFSLLTTAVYTIFNYSMFPETMTTSSPERVKDLHSDGVDFSHHPVHTGFDYFII